MNELERLRDLWKRDPSAPVSLEDMGFVLELLQTCLARVAGTSDLSHVLEYQGAILQFRMLMGTYLQGMSELMLDDFRSPAAPRSRVWPSTT